MAQITVDLSDSSLAAAVKGNLYAFFRSFRSSPLVEFVDLPGLIRWRTPIPHPWFNGALSSLPAEGDGRGSIQEVVAYFRSHGVSIFTWWLEPGLAAQTWAGALTAHGFGFDANTPGMAAELAALPASVPQPENLAIHPVEDRETLQQWASTFIAGYGLPVDFTVPFFDLIASLGLDLPNRHLLGILEGRPVTTSSLFLGAGVAGIYNVATLSEARGRGLGAAMTLFPLLQARQMGYRAGILQSSEMGFNVYRHLGFRKVCAMEHFFWREG